jgi:hypothetical protein
MMMGPDEMYEMAKLHQSEIQHYAAATRVRHRRRPLMRRLARSLRHWNIMISSLLA